MRCSRPTSVFGLLALACGGWLLACGDSTGSGGQGGAAEGGAGGAGASPAGCSADRLCLEVVEAGDPAPGRLAVVWLRFEGNVGHDPTVGYEAAFDGAAGDRIDIPLSEITDPPDIDRACERGCEDPKTCPCTGDFQAAVAYVLVVNDADASGVLEPTELADATNWVGIANAAVAFSETTEASPPAPFDVTFPDGVEAGIHPSFISADGTLHEAGDTEVFQLRAGTEAI